MRRSMIELKNELKKTRTELDDLREKLNKDYLHKEDLYSIIYSFNSLQKFLNDNDKCIIIMQRYISEDLYYISGDKITKSYIDCRRDESINRNLINYSAVEILDNTIRTCKFLHINRSIGGNILNTEKLVSFQNDQFENCEKYNWIVNSTSVEEIPIFAIYENNYQSDVNCIIKRIIENKVTK